MCYECRKWALGLISADLQTVTLFIETVNKIRVIFESFLILIVTNKIGKYFFFWNILLCLPVTAVPSFDLMQHKTKTDFFCTHTHVQTKILTNDITLWAQMYQIVYANVQSRVQWTVARTSKKSFFFSRKKYGLT